MTPPPSHNSLPQQMELNTNPTRQQPGVPASSQTDEELERLKKEHDELNAKKELLRQKQELREQLVVDQKKTIFRLKQSLHEISMEHLTMKEECSDMDRMKDCFERHLKDLEYLDPESWSNSDLDKYLDKAREHLDTANNDHDAAVQYCRNEMSRTHLFGKRQKRGTASADSFKENVMQGFSYHLPVLILGVIALIILLFK